MSKVLQVHRELLVHKAKQVHKVLLELLEQQVQWVHKVHRV